MILLAVLGASAIARAASSYVAPCCGGQVTVNEWGVCKVVTNNAANNLFIPTNTAAEWTNFRTNAPIVSVLGACAWCGDGTCNNGESCGTCPGDCGACPYCGDGICNNGESCGTCGDCGACPPPPPPCRSVSLNGASCESSCYVEPGYGCDAGTGAGVPNRCGECCYGAGATYWENAQTLQCN